MAIPPAPMLGVPTRRDGDKQVEIGAHPPHPSSAHCARPWWSRRSGAASTRRGRARRDSSFAYIRVPLPRAAGGQGAGYDRAR
jgi:hypothetical protein